MQQLEMPAHITSHIQPPDIYSNRQWKLLAERKFGHVQSDDIVRNLYERSNIIIFISLPIQYRMLLSKAKNTMEQSFECSFIIESLKFFDVLVEKRK